MAAPQPPSNRGRDFLDAAINGDLKLVKRLASEVGDAQACERIMDRKGKNALHFAAAGGKTHVCKFLVEKLKFNVKSKECLGNTPLLCALICFEYPTAIYLIENGVVAIDCINPLRGHTALHLAAEQGQEEIMRLLLSKGAKVEPDLSITLDSPLERACCRKNEACVKLLLDNGADAGADPNIILLGRNSLAVAVVMGDAGMVKLLLNAGANANVVDPLWLATPLEMAAIRGDVAKMKILYPITSRISSIPDWSVDGIMKHWRSKETETQIENRFKESLEFSKAKGREAFEKKDYEEALNWYKKATLAVRGDATTYSNQSLCCVKLNRPTHALYTAKYCVKLKPDWAKAHYRMGAAHMLLNEYSFALEAFSRASELDPNNTDIKKAYREALESIFRNAGI